MGTSQGYDAPTSPQWGNLKTQVTNDAKKGYSSLEKSYEVVKKFVKIKQSSGSFRNAANNVAANIGGFLSLVNDTSFREALDEAGLKGLKGRSVLEITYSLADYLSESFNNIDEVDARNALSRLLNDLFQDAKTYEDLENVVKSNSTNDLIEEVLVNFFGYYIYEQFCRVFYERLVQRVGENKAESYLKSIDEYINSVLKHETSSLDLINIDWDGDEGKSITNKILEETLVVFGG